MSAPYPRTDGSQPCAQTDPELWFPEKGGDARRAKRLCNSCEFRTACAEWAIHHDVTGVWGGLSGEERRDIRRERRIVAEPVVPAERSGDERYSLVLRLRGAGMTDAEVAARMGISVKGVQKVAERGKRRAAA